MSRNKRIAVGWREWLALPELGIDRIKAKIDTGARTSALHAFDLEFLPPRDGKDWVRFGMHPVQGDTDTVLYCEAEVIDRRQVTDSGGHQEERPVIKTLLKLGDDEWPIELTLTGRDNMRFRMLLGRTAMRGRLNVRPDKSFMTRPSLSEDDAANEADNMLEED
ncbi:MAG: ATP-dependent zinc protease [Gammaproteobacteria bacterium]|nr:ATP-dependent zinc protease [Gammaproteobacteria bacterium]